MRFDQEHVSDLSFLALFNDSWFRTGTYDREPRDQSCFGNIQIVNTIINVLMNLQVVIFDNTMVRWEEVTIVNRQDPQFRKGLSSTVASSMDIHLKF